MADLVTQISVEVIESGSPNERLTYFAEEVLVQGSPNERLTYFATEVILPSAVSVQSIIWFMA